MRHMFVLYDPDCGLCLEAKHWLEHQAAYVPLILIPAGSPEAVRRFPEVVTEELAAISDTGEVWLDDSAFLMCLWALRSYRSWAVRFSTPTLRPLAKQAFRALSSGRFAISHLFGLRSETELAERLRSIPLPACGLPENGSR